MQRMHERGVFHLNICSANILLKIPPGKTDPLKVSPQDMEVFIIGMGAAALASGTNREVSVAFCSTNNRRIGPSDSRQEYSYKYY